MNQEEILNCILNPDRLKEVTFDRLKQALTDYPYSQNLHFLLAQKSMQEAHPDFERHLKTAATYMSSRSFLRRQLQGSDRPSQPIVEPEPEAEPAQGNSTLIIAPENSLANLPDQELPPVLFIPDEEPAEEVVPNHVADIISDTPPADQPPPNETSTDLENLEDLEQAPPLISKILAAGNQIDDPEIAPIEKKIPIKHEPIIDQPRIIHEPVIEADTEESIAPGSNIPDLLEPEVDEIHDLDLEEENLRKEEFVEDLEEEIPEIIASTPSASEPVIVAFPTDVEFEDEMDDLLNKPLIEVVAEKFVSKDQEIEIEEEDEISDLLLEDFDEIFMTERSDLESEEASLTTQPGIGKWIKKYQSSEERQSGNKKPKKRSKKKNKKGPKEETLEKGKAKVKISKLKKKVKKKDTLSTTEPKGKKTGNIEKTVKNKKAKKKKKKVTEEKLSKKKAIRKFANRSIVEDGETISTTLADLYVKQGKIEKAIVAYERLSLIIPEKKAFFATLIKKLKKK